MYEIKQGWATSTERTCRYTSLACFRMAIISPTTVIPSSFMISLLRSSSMFFWILQGRRQQKLTFQATILTNPSMTLQGPGKFFQWSERKDNFKEEDGQLKNMKYK